MNRATADPARTHALLVGIEKYDAGTRWNLDGPIRDVLAYHAWLVSRGVPPGQILTLLSPLDRNSGLAAAAGVNSAPATAEGVRSALRMLREKKGDLLFVAWAGHGVVNDRIQRLFVADATESDKRNFALDALRETLASSWFTGFARQIIIVDACANHQSFVFSVPSENLPRGEPQNREQFVFFAAQRGQVAINLNAESRGLFSRELLRELQAGGATAEGWPPDMRPLAERVQAAFAEMRATKRRNQTPVYESRRDWEGNEDVLVASPLVGREGRFTGESWKLSFKQQAALAEALLSCRRLATADGRDDLLYDIRPAIRGSTPRRADARSDVMSIVRTASGYPDGLKELLLLVENYEQDSLAWGEVARVVAAQFPSLNLDAPLVPARDGVAAERDLAEALAACPSLATPRSRDDLLAVLGDNIAAGIQRRSETRDDLLAIVRGCARFEDGIAQLLEVAGHGERGTSQWAEVLKAARPLLPQSEVDQ